ncbi:MAG: response regulator [Chitinophagaceae bacterium]|nr:response regulator [Chitinophagaceae bacterium]
MADVKVCIVEDEPLIAEDIASNLRRRNYEVAGVAYAAEEAMDMLRKKLPDIVLVDINLDGKQDGIMLARQITSELSLPFIYITSYSDKKTLELAKDTQPAGYVVKPFTEAGLFATLEIALHNHRQRNRHLYPDLNIVKINQHIPTPLSLREFEVLALIYEGCSNQQIAEKLFVSLNTIKAHIKNAYLKLDTVSRSTTLARLRELMLK